MPRDNAMAVQLVGAGPGPADLLTVRALRAIEGADVVLYDALVGAEVLALAPRGCARIETGKRAGRPSMAQDEINRLMLRLAKRGLAVVRLKGGDPSIFGRVGEEREFLEAHGVRVSVVPGVTAACAAAAQFNFPLTHRGEARRLVFATVRLKDGEVVEDWEWAASSQTTLALYMGRDSAAAVARRLESMGVSGLTPVAAVENAGSVAARLIRSTVEHMSEDLSVHDMTGPVVIIVGAAAGRAADDRPVDWQDIWECATRTMKMGL